MTVAEEQRKLKCRSPVSWTKLGPLQSNAMDERCGTITSSENHSSFCRALPITNPPVACRAGQLPMLRGNDNLSLQCQSNCVYIQHMSSA